TYQYVATYSGDANNNPAGPSSCDDPAETATVTPTATPTPTTMAPLRSPATPPPPQQIHRPRRRR
ncbi:MAG: hypothetical protein M3Y36_06575, partial [Actinomycetota bacterium]|nr:hypothetical protein [Actinomycetota bacterium]